jgi:hypothetical protein
LVIHSSALLTSLNESRVIAMTAAERIVSMTAVLSVAGPKVGSSCCLIIICHVAGIRKKPSIKAIIVPDRIACNSLACMFVLSFIVVINGYSSIL